jgi:hypothetical protein
VAASRSVILVTETKEASNCCSEYLLPTFTANHAFVTAIVIGSLAQYKELATAIEATSHQQS